MNEKNEEIPVGGKEAKKTARHIQLQKTFSSNEISSPTVKYVADF